MKPLVTALALTLAACLPTSARARDAVAGDWQVEQVNGLKPPKGVTLTLSFAEQGRLTVTHGQSGATQSWSYQYTLEDGRLTLAPAKSFGEPQEVGYDIREEDGKLLLLEPAPEDLEPADADAESGEATEDDAAGDDADGGTEASDSTDPADSETAEDTEAAEAADDAAAEDAQDEEPDDREPVWVLVPAAAG